MLANVLKTAAPMVASIIRTIFARPDKKHVHTEFNEVVRMLTRSHPKAAEMLESARDDLLAFAPFPHAHWRQIWSTNPLERVNKEIPVLHRRGRHLPQPRRAPPSGRARPDRVIR